MRESGVYRRVTEWSGNVGSLCDQAVYRNLQPVSRVECERHQAESHHL